MTTIKTAVYQVGRKLIPALEPDYFLTVRNLFTRPFDRLPLHGVGAEIGVNEAVHAAKLLKRHRQIQKLFLVDPYIEYHQEPNRAGCERRAHKRMARVDKAVFCRCTAEQANLPKLDFAYIDANHSYESVKEDIRIVWPLIKSNGIMGGHDFDCDFDGVIRAVTEFVVQNKLRLHVGTPDWWIIKTPETA